MTIAEKLIRAKADMDQVYDAGYTSGISASGGYPLSEFLKWRNGEKLFYNTALTTIPLFDTSIVTNMSSMFHNSVFLTTIPSFDTRNVTDMSYMFYGSTNLMTVPSLDTRNVMDMGYMFYGCLKLNAVSQLYTRNVTDMRQMFYNCQNLNTVSLLDMRNVGIVMSMFYNCCALTDVRLRNIKVGLQVGSGTVYGHLLTVDSLTHLIYELRDTGSSKTLTVGSANLEKLANVYVKLIDITDEMRAEDDLIDEKLPFVVCESTDEGACLIGEYVGFKNWKLA